MDATLAGRGDQHPNFDAALLVSRPIFVDPSDGNLKAVILFACVGLFFPGTVALLNFESNRLMGPNIAGALSSMAPVFAVLLAFVILVSGFVVPSYSP
jgi:drug/metabolite transporter (DMT)-like permease